MLVFGEKQLASFYACNQVTACNDCTSPGCLKIKLVTYFTMASQYGGGSAVPPRYTQLTVGEGAVVSILGASAVTDAGGEVCFSFAGVTLDQCSYTVTVSPPPHRTALYQAGPDLLQGADPYKLPDWLYYPISFELFLTTSADGAIVFDAGSMPAGTALWPPSGPGRQQSNGIVYSVSAKELTIDYKPDFVRCFRFQKRTLASDVRVIVIHRTDGPDISSAFNTLLGTGERPGNWVKSIHYIVDRDGFVVKVLPDETASNHTNIDVAYWSVPTKVQGAEPGPFHVNLYSVGIENVGWMTGVLEEEQYTSLAALTSDLLGAHGLTRHDVAIHRDMQQTDCAGLTFVWKKLTDAGVGTKADGAGAMGPTVDQYYGSLLPEQWPKSYGTENTSYIAAMGYKPEGAKAIKRLKQGLRQIGYQVTAGPHFDADDASYDFYAWKAVYEFGLRFMGKADIVFDRRMARALEAALVDRTKP
jgi:N-acetyl-anhydromuramyl-L-alanine amidase AmpD